MDKLGDLPWEPLSLLWSNEALGSLSSGSLSLFISAPVSSSHPPPRSQQLSILKRQPLHLPPGLMDSRHWALMTTEKWIQTPTSFFHLGVPVRLAHGMNVGEGDLLCDPPFPRGPLCLATSLSGGGRGCCALDTEDPRRVIPSSGSTQQILVGACFVLGLVGEPSRN